MYCSHWLMSLLSIMIIIIIIILIIILIILKYISYVRHYSHSFICACLCVLMCMCVCVLMCVRSTLDSEEEEDIRKGRGCMLHYQHSVVRVLTPFTAQSSASPAVPDPGSEETPLEYFLAPGWQVKLLDLGPEPWGLLSHAPGLDQIWRHCPNANSVSRYVVRSLSPGGLWDLWLSVHYPELSMLLLCYLVRHVIKRTVVCRFIFSAVSTFSLIVR